MIRKLFIVKKNYVISPHNAAAIVQMATKYKSRILLETGNKKANAKSLMGLLTLGIKNGDEVLLIVDGPDQELAIKDLENFFGFEKIK